MAIKCLQLSMKQLLLLLAVATCSYLIIGKSVMPTRLKTTKPRDILSIKQQQQQQHQQNTVNKKSPIISNEKTKGDEESVLELVKNDHEIVLERIRLPDIIDMQRNGTSATVIVDMGDKPLAEDIPLFDELKSRLLKNRSNDLKKICSESEDNRKLIGQLPQAVLLITNLKEAEVQKHYPYLEPGGHWKPEDCTTEHKLAVIIPFRDRQTHLTRLIDFLIPVLKRQQLDFRFIVTEQYGNDLFNKGRIMNAAFRLAERLNVSCVIFHDVDMFPQDDRNFYGCPPTPRHIGAFVSNLGYQLWYKEIVGGVLAISMDDYRTVNGYSNMYWGWGGEDDDMGKRIMAENLTIERPDVTTGRFTMLKHVKRKRVAPKLIHKLLDEAETRYRIDGLNVTSWKILKITLRPLYYHIYVDVGKPPSEWV
ncbi:galactosyltransferase [Loa loa]|uniref:Beta-1,4-N-acetylgalactosaminyltransferase n=1 Tax=Loa loa TaxID=7209 RepID=A0A1I7W5T0_LOALO|nr:galactosyltransferase [Loa loa]EFO18405.1 galactosyltransferase [Loa loa]